ncbi:MAG: site-specific integrase [Coriobacteriales bacterium]|jgi:integrase|nr:site-specific integrase [Coriobacteriales bacterium]
MADSVGSKMILSEFANGMYMQTKRGLRGSTLRTYLSTVRNHIAPHMGHVELADIDYAMVQETIYLCASRHIGKDVHITLRGILTVAVHMGLLSHNVAECDFVYPERIEPPRSTGAIVATFAEHRPILERAQDVPRIELMMIFGLCCGLRKGEIFGLEWQDIDLSAKEINIYQSYTCGLGGPTLHPPKSKMGTRTIPLPKYACARLAELHQGKGIVFPGRKRNRENPTSASNRLRTWFTKNPDLPQVTLFSCRHSFATACVLAGIPLEHISAWLGHCSVYVTRKAYVKLVLVDLHKDVSKIDAAYEL